MVEVAEKQLRVKKLKKPKPAYLIKKGHNCREYMTDKNQCHFYYDDGTRCGSFSKKNSLYCRHHEGKATYKKSIDFDLLEEIRRAKLKKNGLLFSLAEYPQLTMEDICAAIAYGAEMSRERYVEVPVQAAA